MRYKECNEKAKEILRRPATERQVALRKVEWNKKRLPNELELTALVLRYVEIQTNE